MQNPCVAHRGWSGLYPENTLLAIEKALQHPNVDCVEMDVQMSHDGIPIILHDYTLERTTNGCGWVGNYSLKELKKLDAGSWFSPTYAGEPLPTLQEVLSLFRPFAKQGKKLNLEIKRGADFYPGMEEKVLTLIRRYSLESSIILTSFNHETIRTFSQLAPEISKGLLIYGYPVLVEELLTYTGSSLLSMNYPYLTPSFIKPLLNLGIGCIAWTVDDPSHMKKVASVDHRIALCTNHPERIFTP